MVVGVRASLEGGKAYTSEELSRRFGLHGRALEDVLDHLMEKDCLRPVVFHRPRTHGGAVRLAGRFERHLVWQAAADVSGSIRPSPIRLAQVRSGPIRSVSARFGLVRFGLANTV